jgi:hypothetical protein
MTGASRWSKPSSMQMLMISRRDRAGRPAFFGHDKPVGLGEALQHGLLVERAQCAQVDHLGIDPSPASVAAASSARPTPIE